MSSSPVIFTVHGYMSMVIPIPQGKNAQERGVYDLVRKGARNRAITFVHNAETGLAEPTCSFATDDKHVIKFINTWNKKNRKVQIKTDLSLVPLTCPQCDFQTKDGSGASQELLAQHVIDAHFDVGDDHDEEVPLEERSFDDLKAAALEAGFTQDEVNKLRSKAAVIEKLQGEVAE